MKPVIRAIYTMDQEDLRRWEAPEPSRVNEIVYLNIGPKTEKSFDCFKIRVATPAGLALLDADDGVLATRPLLVLQRYEFHILWRWLESTVIRCEADTWSACRDKLSRYFSWEFDHEND